MEQLKKDYYQNLIKINVFHAAQFMYLLEQLDAVPDGGGRTLQDNSAVLWGSEIGDGGSHSYKNIPFILAGSAGNISKQAVSSTTRRIVHPGFRTITSSFR